MSNSSNDEIYETAQAVIEQLGEEFDDGTLPAVIQPAFDRLVHAINKDDLDTMYEISLELGQYLANDAEAI